MDLTVFRQASKTRPDGHIIYKGEDAQPYVGKNIMLVADGLGGAAAIRHQKFNQELFDENKLFDLLFDGVFGDLDDVELREYVTKSFYEFISIKDCYFDNVNNIKKSGYFASRIVATIFLYWAKRFVETISAEDVARCSEEKREEWLSVLSRDYTERIGRMLRAVANNANLIYETSFSGLALLGTTLCATIMYESENYVDAVYFVAGDSRPYMWNEKGLFQVSPDQERDDGGMTNYIKANGDFEVKCEYKRFRKPCILFNASDGIFDSAYFKLSQMALEKLLLETIVEASVFEDIGDILEDIFVDYGTHDDSSTISLKAYGYQSFEELKNAANKRLSSIQETYLKEFPDLLEHDYQKDIDEVENTIKMRYKALCGALWTNEKVVEHYTALVKKRDDAAFLAQMEELKKTCDEHYSGIVALCENELHVTESQDTKKRRPITHEEAINLVDRLISGKYPIEGLHLQQEHLQQINEHILAFKDIRNQISKAEKERDENIIIAAKIEWEEACTKEQDILQYLITHQIITEEECEQYAQQRPSSNDCVDKGLAAKAKKQAELLESYNELYYSLIVNQ